MQTNIPVEFAPSEYNIKSVSGLGSFVAFCTIMLAIISAMALSVAIAVNTNMNTVAMLLTIAGALLLSLFAIRYVLTRLIAQKLSIALHQEGLEIQTRYKPFFDKSPDGKIYWSDIKSYKDYTYPSPRLILYLQSGKKLRFSHFNFGDNSQLAAFVVDFANTISSRETAVGTSTAITRKKTIYEGTSGLVFAGFIIIFNLASLYAIIYMPDAHQTKDVVFVSGHMLVSLGFLAHIISVRKKSKQQQAGE